MRHNSGTKIFARLLAGVPVLCCLCTAPGMAAPQPIATPIPAPPWAMSANGPTSRAEVVNYMCAVLPVLPADALDDLAELVARDVDDATLLAALHAFRLRGCVQTPTISTARFAILRSQPRTRADLAEQLEALRAAPAGPPRQLSLSTSLHALSVAHDLQRRIDNPADSLADLARYAPALRAPGLALHIYERACALLRMPDYARAFNLFAFLVAPTNPNGFTVGNSHYWLGWLLYMQHRNPAAALAHYLEVHRYPACLVFTDGAYIEVANIYRMRGRRDTALALYAMRVPSIDYGLNEHLKLRASYNIARENRDATNQVQQLLRFNELAHTAPQFTTAAAQFRAELEANLSPAVVSAIAAPLAASPFDLYAMQAIQRALTGPDAATNDPALTDMLLHDWPSFDWVQENQPVIVTNRELSNNIFQQKRRNKLLAPLP